MNHHRARLGVWRGVCAGSGGCGGGVAGGGCGVCGAGCGGLSWGRCGPGTVFVYSGQGSQWAGMGRQLLVEEPVFSAAVDDLEPILLR